MESTQAGHDLEYVRLRFIKQITPENQSKPIVNDHEVGVVSPRKVADPSV